MREYDRINYSRAQGNMFWDIANESYELTELGTGLFFEDIIELTDRFSIIPGLKYSYTNFKYSTLTADDKNIYSEISPALHLKYKFKNELFVKANVSKQISRPTFTSAVPVHKYKIKKEKIEKGNPDLKPAHSVNIGASIEKYFNKNSFVSINGYYKYVRNIIDTRYLGIDDDTGFNIFQFINIDTARVYGVDIESRIDLGQIGVKGLSVYGNCSFLGSKVKDPGTGKERNINEQPDYIINVVTDYLNTKYNFNISLGMNYIGAKETAGTIGEEGETIASISEDEYMQWDFKMKYFLGRKYSLYFNITNIFDRKININQGTVIETEVPGRFMRLGVNYSF